jgi:hypothetical protein
MRLPTPCRTSNDGIQMHNDANDIRRSLVAERRNLLITSFVLFFYQQAGLQIEKINVFGNEATVSDPWWIAFALWVLWGYFFLRFYQFFRSTPDKGFLAAHESQMKKLLTRSAFRHFKKQFKKDHAEKGSKYDFKIRDTSFPLSYPQFWTVKLELSIADTREDGAVGAFSPPHEEDFTSTKLLWIKIRSMAHVLVSTHIATEYFLPFLLALLPLWNLLRFCTDLGPGYIAAVDSLIRCRTRHCSDGSLSIRTMDSSMSRCSCSVCAAARQLSRITVVESRDLRAT